MLTILENEAQLQVVGWTAQNALIVATHGL